MALYYIKGKGFDGELDVEVIRFKFRLPNSGRDDPHVAIMTMKRLDRTGYIDSFKQLPRQPISNAMLAWVLDCCMELGIFRLIDRSGVFARVPDEYKTMLTTGMFSGPRAIEVSVDALSSSRWLQGARKTG